MRKRKQERERESEREAARERSRERESENERTRERESICVLNLFNQDNVFEGGETVTQGTLKNTHTHFCSILPHLMHVCVLYMYMNRRRSLVRVYSRDFWSIHVYKYINIYTKNIII